MASSTGGLASTQRFGAKGAHRARPTAYQACVASSIIVRLIEHDLLLLADVILRAATPPEQNIFLAPLPHSSRCARPRDIHKRKNKSPMGSNCLAALLRGCALIYFPRLARIVRPKCQAHECALAPIDRLNHLLVMLSSPSAYICCLLIRMKRMGRANKWPARELASGARLATCAR